MGSSLLEVSLRGADLSGAVFDENSFKVTLDTKTVLHGATGTVFGPAELVDMGQSHKLAGSDLQNWLRNHGADIHVIRNAAHS